MAISDKTRKLLWGRSGNRCAICKKELVVNSTFKDSESVLADECHINSTASFGPRYDASYPAEKLNSYVNLILLCRNHHKTVDDQEETFTADILRQIKSNHEIWVSQKLTDEQKLQPIRFRRIKQNIPDFLNRLTTGNEILNIISNAMTFAFDHDELKSQEDVDLVGGFLQFAQDCGDLIDEFEVGDRVQFAYKFTAMLKEAESAGFWVFGGREVQYLEGGSSPKSLSWPVAIIQVLRKDNPAILSMDLESCDFSALNINQHISNGLSNKTIHD